MADPLGLSPIFLIYLIALVIHVSIECQSLSQKMQTTDTVLMIEPIAFGYNNETAENNHYQNKTDQNSSVVQSKALEEFHAFVGKLRSKGVNVITFKDTLKPHTPDSIFPNNWVSFHKDGKVVLYPMFASNRRAERRKDIIESIKDQGFEVTGIDDWSSSETQGRFLEGTGSMIFDHDNKIAYGSVSARLDEKLFREFCEKYGFTPMIFHSYQTVGKERLPVYHTNVVMSVADQFVVICLDSIDDKLEREKVIETIKSSGKTIVEISEEQMNKFAGNMLQVQNKNGQKFLVMSKTAYQSLTPDQIVALKKYNEIIYSDLNTIEVNGGGSARCMLAEIFLPKKIKTIKHVTVLNHL